MLRSLAKPYSYCLLLLCLAGAAVADDFHLAVASNFLAPMDELVAAYEQRSAHRVLLSPGSSAKHYAQILNGAPFDAFFSADTDKPERLEQEGYAISGSRFTYAVGRLVLLANEPLDSAKGLQNLAGRSGRIAIANPLLAPYGQAARQALEAEGLWQAVQPRLVTGENVAQAMQFVVSGNAMFGLVAKSYQIQLQTESVQVIEVAPKLYAPVIQQAVLLRESKVARDFIAFMQGAEGRAIISRFGYDIP